MNNGLTLTCKRCDVIQNGNLHLQIFSPQLINGQQTIRAWESVFLKESDDKKRKVLQELSVMVRIIFIHNKNLVKQVAFANNRQNPISAVDLRSNEESLKIIEKNFTKINVPFVRKKGEYLDPDRMVATGYQKGIDAKKIYILYKLMREDVASEEAFFDDQKSFDMLFGGLAKKTTDSEKATKRLVGLVNIASIPAVGPRKRDALLKLLREIGLSGTTFPKRGEQPSFRRQMLHACWKKIQSAILHGLLSNNNWEGTDKLIHTYFSDENPVRDLIDLIEVKLNIDLANSINDNFDKFKHAKDENNQWGYDDDNDSLNEFAKQLALSDILQWHEIKPCNLINDL